MRDGHREAGRLRTEERGVETLTGVVGVGAVRLPLSRRFVTEVSDAGIAAALGPPGQQAGDRAAPTLRDDDEV